jgi:predicted XRE-type DNA-binding protein
MNIDTTVRHVTPADANLFVELGFSGEDAAQFEAQSLRQINDTRLLKAQLMGELSKWIDDNHLKQAQAAEILMVSRPRVSDVVNMKVGKFTIDTLVDMLSRIGKPVRLVVS